MIEGYIGPEAENIEGLAPNLKDGVDLPPYGQMGDGWTRNSDGQPVPTPETLRRDFIALSEPERK